MSTTQSVVPARSMATGRPARSRRGRARRLSRMQAAAASLLVLLVLLLGWQVLPNVSALRSISPVFNPFFVSSPVKVAHELTWLALGQHGVPAIWSYLAQTLVAMLIGLAVGLVAGVAVGLMMSNSVPLYQVFGPFISALNAMPKIAVIPIIIILLGPTRAAAITTSSIVVFFAVFFNAYNGGKSVPEAMLQKAVLLGASPTDSMVRIRLRYVSVWTFAGLPNGIAHALIGVITTEVFGGVGGVGNLLVQALSLSDATLTISVAIVVGVTGAVLVAIGELLSRRFLHWWPSFTDKG